MGDRERQARDPLTEEVAGSQEEGPSPTTCVQDKDAPTRPPPLPSYRPLLDGCAPGEVEGRQTFENQRSRGTQVLN